MKLTKVLRGRYRLSHDAYFSNICLVGREWHADIRHSDTGNLIRYAGIWKTRTDAIAEVTGIIYSLSARYFPDALANAENSK